MPPSLHAEAEAIGRRLGVAGTRWRRRKNVFQFRAPAAGFDDDAVLRVQQDARRRRRHLIASPILRGDRDDCLLLFEADDKYEVISQVGPDIPNAHLGTEEIIAWLRELEAGGYPFQLMGCARDTVVGVFEHRLGLPAARTLAPRFKAFCTDILLTVPGRKTVENLAKHMADINGFVLAWVRWDA